MAAPGTDVLTARDHRRIAAYIGRVAGIQLPESKRSLIEGRLRKRQRLLGHRSLHAYIEFALDPDNGRDERLHLLDAITTNKTDFYREPDHFRYLREHVAGELAPRRARGWRRPLQVWSAGCASGEEPYTLAIELLEVRRDYPGFRFSIRATDISPSSLAAARDAVYPHDRVEPMPLVLRQRYLLRSRDRKLVRMAPEVRETVRFATFNLLTDTWNLRPPPDVIFCRNVMIYFGNPDRTAIAERFAHVLSPGGLLFIGHSETLTGRGPQLQQLRPTIYQKQPEHERP